MTDPTTVSARDLARLIRDGALSSTEVVQAFLARIERLNPVLNAVVELDPEAALAAAARLDRQARRTDAPLAGVPVLLKDSNRVAGFSTTVGDPSAPKRPASRDGFVANRLRAAGSIILGKTNVSRDLADFQTENPVYGRTVNPWDPTRTPGGSSGGAASAVAARLTPVDVGSDIAGSIRLPAHFCGIIGLKPSEGAISTRGHVVEPTRHPRGGGIGALATIGPLARSFDDIELLLDLLAGGLGPPPIQRGPLRLALIDDWPGLRVEHAVRAALLAAAEAARAAGARVDSVRPPLMTSELHASWVAVYRAAQAYGGRWRSVNRRTLRRLSAARSAWDDLLSRYDAVLCPPTMCVAFEHRTTGAPIDVDGQEVPYWGLGRLTETFNLTGHPALVVPAGITSDRLPTGVQMVGSFGDDSRLTQLGEWFLHLLPPMPEPDSLRL